MTRMQGRRLRPAPFTIFYWQADNVALLREGQLMRLEYRGYCLQIGGHGPNWQITARPLNPTLPIMSWGAATYVADNETSALNEAKGEIDRLLERFRGRC